MKISVAIILLLLVSSLPSFAYELMVIQGVSNEKQTFVTRGGKDKNIFEGQNMTFTTDNVSLIAKAVKVTRSFTQWEIKNDYTDIPFRRGELVTMYKATEHLWALSPGKVRRKYIKNEYFQTNDSFEGGIALTRGISETVSEAENQETERGGYHFDGMYKSELSLNWAYAVGLRLVKEVVNTPFASFVNQRFLGVAEARYYFEPIDDFYRSRIGLSLGLGYGQSRTETDGQSSFGDAFLLPSTKISLDIPINEKYDFGTYAAFESLRLEEEFADGNEQTTNLINSKIGFIIRMNLKDPIL